MKIILLDFDDGKVIVSDEVRVRLSLFLFIFVKNCILIYIMVEI